MDCKIFFTFTMLWTCSVQKNGVDLVEVNFFFKSAKMNGQTVFPKKIKTVALLYLIIADFFCSFYNTYVQYVYTSIVTCCLQHVKYSNGATSFLDLICPKSYIV